MDHDTQMARTRRCVVFVVQVGATVAVIGGFWFLFSALVMSSRPLPGMLPSSAGVSDSREEVRSPRRARAEFPLPLYPGARDPEFGRMDVNGKAFHRCDYEVSSSPQRVLRFYHQRLRARGWRNTTEDDFRKATRAPQGERATPLSLQNETLLRYYDHVMRTQATFARRNGHVLVTVRADPDKATRTQVGVQFTEYGSPEELAADLEAALGGPNLRRKAFKPITFGQDLGNQRAETTMLTRRGAPASLLRALVAQYCGDGWRELHLPEKPSAKGSKHYACLTRGREMVFLNAGPDKRKGYARAVITVLRPR